MEGGRESFSQKEVTKTVMIKANIGFKVAKKELDKEFGKVENSRGYCIH